MKYSFLFLIFFISTLFAHESNVKTSGRLNSSGCHNSKTAGYHCHNGSSTPTPPRPSSPTYTYLWKFDEWGECKGLCGEKKATQERKVYCQRSDGRSSSYCSSESKPSTTRACTLVCPVEPVPQESIQTPQISCDVKDTIFSDAQLFLSQVAYLSSYYEVTLAQIEQSLCFDITSIKSLNDKCPVIKQKPLFSDKTKLLMIPSVNVTTLKLGVILESINGHFCVTDAREEGKCVVPEHKYNRDNWKHWSDFDNDCQNTRIEVLNNENQLGKTINCNISTGKWLDIYNGNELTNSSDIDMDHIVSLSWAHQHGASNWSKSLKEVFANDEINLLPTSASTNRSKGSKAPYQWLPKKGQCTFIDRWKTVVDKYNLCLSADETKQLVAINCTD